MRLARTVCELPPSSCHVAGCCLAATNLSQGGVVPLAAGSGVYGRLGDGFETSRKAPVAVSGGHTFADIAAGNTHTCGVLANGSALCWGYGGDGQIGNADNSESTVAPAAVAGNFAFSSIHSGSSAKYTCGILTNGSALCWGVGDSGQLGDGAAASSNIPVGVSGNYLFSQLATGSNHACGVLTNGTALCWGDGTQGQLGNGAYTTSSTPCAVSGGYTFAQIAAGGFHSCGILTNGSALCWGSGSSGRLGNGASTSSSTPKAVSGGYTFSWIAAGNAHTCGILVNGSAMCWGLGSKGQLGQNATTSSNTPVAVKGDGTFSRIAGGGASYSCGVLVNGSAQCWGDNSFGQLGSNSTGASTVPVAVAGGLQFTALQTGEEHTCGIVDDS
ncbi:Ultraviolet-B receptor 8 [Chlorella vulgaris]